MSGLTGYLAENGSDLSYIFMSIMRTSLFANNTFTGKNTFSGGIGGPSTALTYTSDMIGYSVASFGNGSDVTNIGSLTWRSINTTGFTFPAIGVWILCINIYCDTSATTGNIIFMNTGLGTTSDAAPVGQGSLETTILATSSTPAVAGYCSGSAIFSTRITSTTTPYYIVMRAQYSGPTIALRRTNCFYQITRIA